MNYDPTDPSDPFSSYNVLQALARPSIGLGPIQAGGIAPISRLQPAPGQPRQNLGLDAIKLFAAFKGLAKPGASSETAFTNQRNGLPAGSSLWGQTGELY